MASLSIHLAIANKYLEKNKVEDEEDFIFGSVDVDLLPDKYKSHYTSSKDTSKLKLFSDNKVNLKNYAKENNPENSYEKGYFLHLLTDYYFYTEYFDKEFIETTSYIDFKKIIYHDYSVINKYVDEKYKVVYSPKIPMFPYEEGIPIVLTINSIYNFIEKMGNLNLEEEYKKINN